jgi:hypothetical protein
VLIPAGGVSLDGQRWIRVDDHPALAPGTRGGLGRAFRAAMLRRLARLNKRGRLRLPGPLVHLADPPAFNQWLSTIAPRGFRVYVQPPPDSGTRPEVVLRYLARYISGGPISDSRLVAHENGQVTFMARPGAGALPGTVDRNEPVPVTIDEAEFVRRWALHILPRGFVRVRHYGQCSPRLHRAWLARCRQLLGHADREPDLDPPHGQIKTPPPDEGAEEPVATHHCPKCGRPMKCTEFSRRPSWRITLTGEHRPDWYT